MDPVQVPAADSAPPAPVTETITATRAAANAGSFADFDKASSAARDGKPLPDVAAPVAAAAAPVADAPPADAPPAAPADKPLNRREREQHEANERVRRAVDLATKDLRAEIAALKGKPAEAPGAPAAAATVADYERYLAMPDAPKEEAFDNYAKYTAAVAVFVHDQRAAEAVTARTQKEQSDQQTQALRERTDRYADRLAAAQEADPDVLAKFPPAVMSVTPISHCERTSTGLIDPSTGRPPTFANLAAEVALRSDNPAAFLTHLHAHQDETVRIAALPEGEWYAALTRLDGRVSGTGQPPVADPNPAAPAPAAPAAPSPISAAPPPPPTLSKAGSTTNPKQAAVARGDFGTFDKLETQDQRARLTHA